VIDESGELGRLMSEVLVVVAQSLAVLPRWTRLAMPPPLKLVQLVHDDGVVPVKGIARNASELTQGLGSKRGSRAASGPMTVQFQ